MRPNAPIAAGRRGVVGWQSQFYNKANAKTGLMLKTAKAHPAAVTFVKKFQRVAAGVLDLNKGAHSSRARSGLRRCHSRLGNSSPN